MFKALLKLRLTVGILSWLTSSFLTVLGPLVRFDAWMRMEVLRVRGGGLSSIRPLSQREWNAHPEYRTAAQEYDELMPVF